MRRNPLGSDAWTLRPARLAVRSAFGALGLLAAAACGVFVPPRGCGAQTRLQSLSLPPGFSIAIYADGVAGARSLALGARGPC